MPHAKHAIPKKEVRSAAGKEIRIATGADGQRTLSGYASVFNSLSVDLGGWFEIVTPSAFTRTLKESPDVYALYAHKAPMVLGRTASRTLALEVDDKGLAFTIKLPDTNAARDLAVLIERGDVDACSFGFMCVNDIWTEDGEGRIVRQLLDVDLQEITVTPMPAYPATSVSIRSAPKEIRIKLQHRDDADDAECGCDCDSCVGGDCDSCSNADCVDPECDCAQNRSARAVAESASTRERMGMQLRVAQARMK